MVIPRAAQLLQAGMSRIHRTGSGDVGLDIRKPRRNLVLLAVMNVVAELSSLRPPTKAPADTWPGLKFLIAN